MSDTNCGHERSVLKTALSHPELCQAWSTEIESVNAHQCAWLALQDPAKLAAMLAERGRELGLRIIATHWDTFWDAFWSCDGIPDYVLCWNDSRIHCHRIIKVGENDTWPIESMDARALLAAWLELPDGDRMGAEKALKGGV